jgi:uncharacterized integral membrane protein
MLALALALLAIVALLVIASFAGSSDEIVIEFLNVTVTASVGGVFVAGVISGLVALASVLTARVSWRRRRKRNKEIQELRRRAAQTTPAPEPVLADSAEPAPAVTTTEDAELSTPDAEPTVSDSGSTSETTPRA